MVLCFGIILLCPKSKNANLDLKIDYRLVSDNNIISLTTEGRGLTGIAMTYPSQIGLIVSFRRAFGDARQSNFPFTRQLHRTLILGEYSCGPMFQPLSTILTLRNSIYYFYRVDITNRLR